MVKYVLCVHIASKSIEEHALRIILRIKSYTHKHREKRKRSYSYHTLTFLFAFATIHQIRNFRNAFDIRKQPLNFMT